MGTKENPVVSEGGSDYGSTRFIVAWTVLIMFGLGFEFLGRLFGYANNPLSFYLPILSVFAGIVAIVVILSGIFVLARGREKHHTMTIRKGVMLFVLGGAMLVGFFVFKLIVPRIFG
jgi:glucose uptake protein GlcU